jgi:hypothetical protein
MVGAAAFGIIAGIAATITLNALYYHADTPNFPGSKSITLGSPTTLKQGVSLRDVGYRRETKEGKTFIVISGTIVNTAEQALPVPKSIRISLEDEHYNELFGATVPSKVANLGAGASVTFKARIHDVDDAAPKLEMVFQN